MEIKALIDTAAKVVGGMRPLSEKIGQPQSRLRDWKSGVKACPLKQQVRLCEIAGFTPAVTGKHVLRAAAENRPTPGRRRRARGQTTSE